MRVQATVSSGRAAIAQRYTTRHKRCPEYCPPVTSGAYRRNRRGLGRQRLYAGGPAACQSSTSSCVTRENSRTLCVTKNEVARPRLSGNQCGIGADRRTSGTPIVHESRLRARRPPYQMGPPRAAMLQCPQSSPPRASSCKPRSTAREQRWTASQNPPANAVADGQACWVRPLSIAITALVSRRYFIQRRPEGQTPIRNRAS